MTAYATVGVVDPAVSHVFYDTVLATIGWSSHSDFPGWRGYSKGASTDSWSGRHVASMASAMTRCSFRMA